MAIRVVCPACDAAFSVSDELKGKKIRCRECEKPVPVGAQPKKAVDDDEPEERIQTKPRKPAPSRPRDDDDEDKRRPRRKAGRYDDENDDDDEDRKPKRKEKKSSPLPWILAAVGGSVVVLGAVIGLVIYLTSKKKEPANNNQPNPADFMAKMKGGGGPPGGMAGMQGGGMMGGGMQGGKAGMPKGGDELVDPNVLKRIDAATQFAKALDPDVLKKIEGCTVQFEVMDSEKNPTYPAHGSGFLAFEPGLVLTNAHVVSMLEPGTEKPEVVKVFIHRGTPEQKELKGEILGVDRKADLAVVRVDPTGLPEPLVVKPSAGLQATSAVYVCGFPYVGQFAVSNRVSVFQGQVASLHYDKNGTLDKVILSSEMQHGNSGGPVVNDKGEVVGVNVAGFEGTRVNMAVPGEYVHVIVNGRLSHQRIGQSYRSQARVSVPITFEVINPLDHVQKVEVEVWVGDDTKDYRPPSTVDTPPSPRQGDSKRERFAFELRSDKTSGAERASGSIVLPVLPQDLPEGKAFWWQPILTFKNKDKTFTQWLSGEKYTPDEPADRRSIKLVHKNHPGSRKVSLSIKHKFIVNTIKGEKELSVDFICDMNEKMLAADAQGKSVLTITVEKADKVVHIPEELLEDKKEREMDPEEKRALENASFLELRLLLNNRGGIESAAFTAKGAPPDIKHQVEELGQEILDGLQSVYIQLPNRTIGHLEPWKAEKPTPIPIILPFGSASAPMKLEYNYLGVLSPEGHEEGRVEMTGNFRSKGGRILQVGGHLEGRALVDVEAGIVKLARARVNTHTELRLRNLHAQMNGTMEITMRRELVR